VASSHNFTARQLGQMAEMVFGDSPVDPSLAEIRIRKGTDVNPYWSLRQRGRLTAIEAGLAQSVKGQPQAIAVTMAHLRSASRGTQNAAAEYRQSKPVFYSLYVGPPGTGKTLLARKLAKALFGSEDACVVFNGSEFSESHRVSSLIGSPNGYESATEGGKLTNAVRANPFLVILFDEIEKAHPAVIRMLLQVLGQGQLADGLGNTVDFGQCIIIFTSNIGFTELPHGLSPIGRDLPRAELLAATERAVEAWCIEHQLQDLYSRWRGNIIPFSYLDRGAIAELFTSKYNQAQAVMMDGLDGLVVHLGDAFRSQLTEEVGAVVDNGGSGRDVEVIIQQRVVAPVTEWYFATPSAPAEITVVATRSKVLDDGSPLGTFTVELA
jgi:ATP-dependent Clp protease ATP-binding subunit ClpA